MRCYDSIVSPLNYFDGPSSERYSDLEDLHASVVDFGRVRDHFLDAARPLAEHAAGDRVEMAGADLLRQAVTLARKLRRSLYAFAVHYAILWVRVHSREEEEPDDDMDMAAWALDTFAQQLEIVQESMGGISECRSRDGRVRASVDDRMKLIELDFEPRLLEDPEYKAAVIEAVNAGIEPAFRRRNGIGDALLAGPEPLDEAAEVDGDEAGGKADDPVFCLLDALCVVEEVQNQLAQLLPRISRIEDPPSLAERIDEIVELCQEAEPLLRDHLPAMHGYRDLLYAKARLPDLTADDLAELEGCVQLFLDEDLDEVDEPVHVRGADISEEARELVATVGDELQRQDQERKHRLSWQRIARYKRSQIAAVEGQTFEGHSRDGSVTARARGTAQLIDLSLDAGHRSEPARIRAAVIEAINSVIETAVHQRGVASMIAPG